MKIENTQVLTIKLHQRAVNDIAYSTHVLSAEDLKTPVIPSSVDLTEQITDIKISTSNINNNNHQIVASTISVPEWSSSFLACNSRLRSALCRPHPPQRSVLGHIHCFRQYEIKGSQILQCGAQPYDAGASSSILCDDTGSHKSISINVWIISGKAAHL